jgi:uncharacterized membrane protein YfcA
VRFLVFWGSLTGLGGATFLVPIYTLYFDIPIVYASGASLISTIATSSGAASACVKDRITNVRIGMGLEIATTSGSIVGGFNTIVCLFSPSRVFDLYNFWYRIIITSLCATNQIKVRIA